MKMFQFMMNEIYNRMEIYGSDNKEFDNALNSSGERLNLLSANDVIVGDYFIFDYSGHNGDTVLFQCDSIEEAESSILDPGGIINKFTTYQIAIIKGKIQDYDIYFINEDGVQVKFIKGIHDSLNFDIERMTSLRVEWIDHK
jgi:hypothetical protein